MIVCMSSSSVDWSTSGQSKLRSILLGMAERPSVLEEADRLRPIIQQHCDIVLEDFRGSQDLSQIEADVAIVLGGDGSILRAANQMAYNQLPVLGVNLGRLGFLADLATDELGKVFPDVRAGNCRIVRHLMFECRVRNKEKTHSQRLGLNEVAILGGPPYSMLDVDLYVDSELATTYSCDGLIVSTPVGSTGHILSAGGPILRKDLQAFVVSPISPHTLTVRPVVDSADRVYEMAVRQPNKHTSVVVDGRVLCPLTSEDRVSVERSPAVFQSIEVGDHTYYRTLRDKLDWSGRIRSKRE